MIALRTAISIPLLFLAHSAWANIIFIAHLTPDQEVPPIAPGQFVTSTGAPRPASFGTAQFVLNDAQTALSMVVTVHNIDVTGTQTADLNDNLVNAHIHVGAAPGTNAPVRWGFIGTPFNNTSPNDGVLTPFVSGVGGVFTGTWNELEGNAGTTLTSNLPAILAELSYINFHTVQFGGGEIRGQILVPVPPTLALLGLGLAGLAWLRRRS